MQINHIKWRAQLEIARERQGVAPGSGGRSTENAGDLPAAHVKQPHSGKENSWLKGHLIYNTVNKILNRGERIVTRDDNGDDDRRAFLKACGGFAAVTPPVMTLLLSTSLTSRAIARSGGLHGGTQNDRGQSFFDNDRSSAAGPGSSSGASSGGGGAPGSLSAGSSRAGGTSGGGGSGGSGGSGGGGGSAKGPFATGGSSGIPSANGGLDCADEDEEKRKANCPGTNTRISSATESSR